MERYGPRFKNLRMALMRARSMLFYLVCICVLAQPINGGVLYRFVSTLPKYNNSPHTLGSVDIGLANDALFKAISVRGGFSNEEEDEEEDDDADEEDDEDDFDIDELDDDGVGNEDAQKQNQLMLSLVDMWIKTPPITQIYVGASIGLTLAAFLFNKNQWPEVLNLDWKSVLGLQVWRVFTAFLFFGPLGFNYILTIHFVWTYMAQLEKLNYKNPEDFLTMLVFGGAALMVGYAVLGLSPKFLGHNLSTFLVYIWARVFEGTDVNVMDLFNLKAEYLPWFFCLQTAVLEGEMPFADILGIVVGHLYQYLTQQRILTTPSIVRNYFASDKIKKKYMAYKDDFE